MANELKLPPLPGLIISENGKPVTDASELARRAKIQPIQPIPAPDAPKKPPEIRREDVRPDNIGVGKKTWDGHPFGRKEMPRP